MAPSPTQVVEELVKPHGFDFDLEESYRKLISFQFGGHPARGFCELIQNSIDSYPSATPFDQRVIELRNGPRSVVLADRGEGLTLERLQLLTTLGGTDKLDHEDKMGRFGMGFFSIFNPRLGTRKIEVLTRCQGRMIQLVFHVDRDHPEALPRIETELLEPDRTGRGTKISVFFKQPDITLDCIQQAKKFLHYFPCKISINGVEYTGTAWNQSARDRSRHFQDGACHGFVESHTHRSRVTILCKYEHVMDSSLKGLLTGSQGSQDTLDVFQKWDFPIVLHTRSVVNHNGLNVTVSRDGFMMDHAYRRLLDSLRKAHVQLLLQRMDGDLDSDLIVANQYTLCDRLAGYLGDRPPDDSDSPLHELLTRLARAPVYRLSGKPEPVSLQDIRSLKTRGRPIFFSPQGTNARWMGGAFDHDFVVRPPACGYHVDSNRLYDTIFASSFEDVVNLDTVRDRPDLIENLVRRDLVDKDLLAPKCTITGQRSQTPSEAAFIQELDALLEDPCVLATIRQSLAISPESIRAGFFDQEDASLTLATGLFHGNGEIFDNLNPDRTGHKQRCSRTTPLTLGLSRTHPVIEHLVAVPDPYRAYYALTFLAHELVGCQKLLAPYTPFRNWVTKRLANGLRQVLVERLLEDPEVD